MAARIKANLHGIHVVMSDRGKQSDEDKLLGLRQLCLDVGADWTELESDDPAKAIVDFAKTRQITQIVTGPSQRGRLQERMGGGSIVRRVSRSAAEAGIDVHIIARRHMGDAPERVAGMNDPNQSSEGGSGRDHIPPGPRIAATSVGWRAASG